MKILHLIPSLRKGGAERLVLDIVRALNRIPGTDAQLAVMCAENEYEDEYPEIKPVVLNSKVVPSITGKWLVDTADWDKLIREYKPKVIHSHLFEAEMLSRYRPVPGIKYVTHCHDNMHQLKKLGLSELFNKKRLTEAYERHFMISRYRACANRFLAISADTYTYFTSQLPPDLAARVHLFPNAVDLSRFSAQKASYPSGETIRLINVGSFVANKNHTFLVDVMQEICLRGLSFRMILAGDGPLKEEVQRKTKQLGLADFINFPGNVSGIERLYAESHVYVHSAVYESFGLVLIEAMAAGLPVVCLDGKGNRDIIQQGKNGFIIYEQNVEKFAKTIINLINDKDTYQRMSEYAKEFVKQFDLSLYIDKLLGIYDNS